MNRLPRLLASLPLALLACGQPPSWQALLAAKISQQYPDVRVDATADGKLLVRQPGAPDAPVDVDAIARFCQRGPKDCNYATDQMLLELRSRPGAVTPP